MSKRKLYRKSPQRDVACVPCIKVKLNDLDALEREAQDRVSYSEKNIDAERSAQNLFVHGLDKDGYPIIDGTKFEIPLRDRILGRIKQTGATIRTDRKKARRNGFVERGRNTKESVLAIGMELQVSHGLAMDMLREDRMLDPLGRITKGRSLPRDGKTYRFFRDAYKWVCDRYGEENVAGAYIHLDEYTPHMHAFVIPIAFKPRRYKKKVLLDKDGNVLMTARLDAKDMFDPSALKRLWKDFGAEMRNYGATAARGLLPKGAYDQAASMEAVLEQKQRQLADIDTTLAAKRNEMRFLQENMERLSESARPFEMIHARVVERLQEIVDRTDPDSAVTVVDYIILEENRVAFSQTGVKTPYVSRQYKILGVSDGKGKELIVDMNDYYNAVKNPLKKAVARFFHENLEPARLGAEIHSAAQSVKKTELTSKGPSI